MIKKENHLSQFLRVLFISLFLIVISSGFVFAQTVILNQPPNQQEASPSDPDFNQSLAENFVVNSTANIIQIRIWGCYASSNIVPATDNFTVIFHADSSGSPGAAISTQNNVPVVRQATGGNVAIIYTEYLYTLTLATPVTLTPGTYWVEIYNNSTGDFFAWEKGNIDPTNGLPNLAWAETVPGSDWHPTDPSNLAIEIIKESATEATPVPTLNEWGIIVFIILAGFGAVVYLRRQNKTTR
jgi:hypothetical protein